MTPSERSDREWLEYLNRVFWSDKTLSAGDYFWGAAFELRKYLDSPPADAPPPGTREQGAECERLSPGLLSAYKRTAKESGELFVWCLENLRPFPPIEGKWIDEVKRRLKEHAELRGVVDRVNAVLIAAPELNPVNFNEDDALALNAAVTEACHDLQETVTPAPASGEGEAPPAPRRSHKMIPRFSMRTLLWVAVVLAVALLPYSLLCQRDAERRWLLERMTCERVQSSDWRDEKCRFVFTIRQSESQEMPQWMLKATERVR